MEGEVKGELANGVGSQYPSHYLGTWCIQHYYRWCANLGCQLSTELTPPADLNELVRLAERRNLVSAIVSSHFNWPLLKNDLRGNKRTVILAVLKWTSKFYIATSKYFIATSKFYTAVSHSVLSKSMGHHDVSTCWQQRLFPQTEDTMRSLQVRASSSYISNKSTY
jgi:hypothetical protein